MLINLSLPESNGMEILLTILYFLLFCLALYKIPFFRHIPGISFRMLVTFFALKVIAGISLILIYTWYYDLEIADFHKYFKDGMVMYGAAKENPLDYLRMLTGIQSSADHLFPYYEKMDSWFRSWESPVYNDNRLVIRFNALAGIFSFGYLHVHNIFINFLSLSGLVAIYRFMLRYTDTHRINWLPWGVFLFPGLLFWGSGILKEGLLIFSFGFWVYFSDKLINRSSAVLRNILYLMFFSFLVVLLKPYTLAIWLPCAISFYVSRKYKASRIIFTYALVFSVFTLFMFLTEWITPLPDLPEIITRKQNDFVEHALALDAGSIIHTRYLEPGFWSFFSEFLKGLFNTLFRPHPLEAYSVFVGFAALENLIIWGMFVYALLYTDRKCIQKNPVFWLALIFSLFLMGFVGMVTPLHGAIVRYRIMALPFLWLAWIHASGLPVLKKISFPKI
ncbi:MAG: hypothetical protein ABR597_07685 [Bacteroidales bacterium]